MKGYYWETTGTDCEYSNDCFECGERYQCKDSGVGKPKKSCETIVGLSYKEYLSKTVKTDCRDSWVDWKVECSGMEYSEARKVSYDSEWGYEQLP